MTDFFEFDESLVEGYRCFLISLTSARAPDIRQVVAAALDCGDCWPEPVVQPNANCKRADVVQSPAARGEPEPARAEKCRSGKPDGRADDITLLFRQMQALTIAAAGQSHVVATGAGSGTTSTHGPP